MDAFTTEKVANKLNITKPEGGSGSWIFKAEPVFYNFDDNDFVPQSLRSLIENVVEVNYDIEKHTDKSINSVAEKLEKILNWCDKYLADLNSFYAFYNEHKIANHMKDQVNNDHYSYSTLRLKHGINAQITDIRSFMDKAIETMDSFETTAKWLKSNSAAQG